MGKRDCLGFHFLLGMEDKHEISGKACRRFKAAHLQEVIEKKNYIRQINPLRFKSYDALNGRKIINII